MMNTTHRIAEIFAKREGWTSEDGTYTRAGIETGDLAGMIMLAARRGPNLGARADAVDFVFVADGDGVWGIGRAVKVTTRPGREGAPHRCFLVDPYDVPAEVRKALVGHPRPHPFRAGGGVQYGVLVDGVVTMDAHKREPVAL
ncbi:MAG TPA: hypothetical protein VLI04_14865 [Nocardioidaceae bacterium]|nr:hypothetical protein [Nocardioidaceae bacterium]